MHVITNSIYSIQLSASDRLGTKHIIDAETTLNEKFNIPDVVYDDTSNPNLICLTIGRVPTLVDASIDADTYRPSIINATLFEHMPFIIRPKELDLTSVEQASYRLRSEFIKDDNEYVAYYGLLIDTSETDNATILIENVDDALVPRLLVPSEHSPLVPTAINTPRLITDNIKYVIVSESVLVTLASYILKEIYLAAKLLRPDDDVVIGELGLCSAIDGTRSINLTDAPVTYSELAVTQLNFTVKKNILLLTGGNTGVDVDDPVFKTITENIELGGMENVIINAPIREIPWVIHST